MSWWACQKKRWRWELAAVTLSAAQLPAAWGQHLETWEVCHLEGSYIMYSCRRMQTVTQTYETEDYS